MKHPWQFILMFCLLYAITGEAQVSSEKKIHLFGFSDLRSSIRHELGASFFTHGYRSPRFAVRYALENSVAYPSPVYNRGTGLISMHYEPRLRLIEFGSNASITLDIPLVIGLTLVDLTTPEDFSYGVDSLSDAAFNAGIFSNERSSELGVMHTEYGGMLSFNCFQGATFENTAAIGFSAGIGMQRVSSPLIMNFIAGYDREDYQDMLSWWTPVARFMLHFRGVALAYTIGVNPTRVYYESSVAQRSVYTNTYNRFSFSLRLGR